MRRAAAAFLVRDGLALLARRSPTRAIYPDVWDAVGGHIEPGETPSDALDRELREELGITATEFREIAVLGEPNPERYGPAEYHTFVVTLWSGGEPSMRGDEHVSIRWCRLDEALDVPLAHPGYVDLLRQILSQRDS